MHPYILHLLEDIVHAHQVWMDGITEERFHFYTFMQKWNRSPEFTFFAKIESLLIKDTLIDWKAKNEMIKFKYP